MECKLVFICFTVFFFQNHDQVTNVSTEVVPFCKLGHIYLHLCNKGLACTND